MSRTSIPTPTPSEPRSSDRRVALIAMAAVAVIGVGAFLAGGASTTSKPPETVGFTTSGTVSTGSVTVEGSEIAMGVVPLDVTVTPTWRLVNNGTDTVTLGEPHASVLEGCCPGQLLLDRTEIPAGATATLTFPLQMHAGMDGPHDFDVHVPIAGSDDVLTLGVTGTFG